MPFQPESDYPHPVPPEALAGGHSAHANLLWKENWVFCALDVGRQVATLFHISLRPRTAEGIFTAKVNVGGWGHKDVDRHSISVDLGVLREVVGERLTLTIVEPGLHFKITYRSDRLDADLTFKGRFPAWDFRDGPQAPGPAKLGELGRWAFHFDHCEQAMAMQGRLSIKSGELAGRVLQVTGFGNRDHSWGWRDDNLFYHHQWICASFTDRFVQGTVMEDATYPGVKVGGFTSTVAGNVAVLRVEADHFEKARLPALDQDVRYRIHGADGSVHTVVAHLSRDIGRHYLNWYAADRSQAYEDCQVFCEYTLEETKSRGSGVLEVGQRIVGRARVEALRRR